MVKEQPIRARFSMNFRRVLSMLSPVGWSMCFDPNGIFPPFSFEKECVVAQLELLTSFRGAPKRRKDVMVFGLALG